MNKTDDPSDETAAVVPQLERELVAAASRVELLANDHGPAVAHEPRRWRWRRSRGSSVLLGSLVTLACAAGAFAAGRSILTGSPIKLPTGIPLRPHSGLGVPRPGSSASLSLQTADPQGGPPWGARLVSTTRGEACLQIGRVVRGQLGVIGQDGAFANDGRFHALPLDYLDGPFPCGNLDADGHAFAGLVFYDAPASGLLAETGCTPPGRPIDRAERPKPAVCPARDERLLMAGLAGPRARSITYADEQGRLHTVSTAGPDGAYLIVLNAPSYGLESGEYTPLAGAGAGTIRSISYSTGHVCRLPHAKVTRAWHVCPNVGEVPVLPAGLNTASIASRIEVTQRTTRVTLKDGHVSIPALQISFRAHAPVTSASEAYWVAARFPGHAPLCGATEEGPVERDVKPGEIVHTAIYNSHDCRGVFHIEVRYSYGADNRTPARGEHGKMLLVGKRGFTAR